MLRTLHRNLHVVARRAASSSASFETGKEREKNVIKDTYGNAAAIVDGFKVDRLVRVDGDVPNDVERW